MIKILLLLLFLVSCRQETVQAPKFKPLQKSAVKAHAVSAEKEDFSDLEKSKDESCGQSAEVQAEDFDPSKGADGGCSVR